jgi:hypothetical protein
MCKTGVVGLKQYKKDRNKTIRRFRGWLDRTAEDGIVGSVRLVEKGPEHKWGVEIKPPPDLVQLYDNITAAHEARQRLKGIDRQLGHTNRKNVA